MEVCDDRPEVIENCKSYLEGRCWYCTDQSLYHPENKKILCKRQIKQREERRLKEKIRLESEASKRGRRAKKKGYMGEREVVELLNKNGIAAERVPLSGALKTEKYSCDVVLENGKRIEVKRRSRGLVTIQKWLNEDKNSNYLFYRDDGNKENWIVIMSFREFVELMEGEKS